MVCKFALSAQVVNKFFYSEKSFKRNEAFETKSSSNKLGELKDLGSVPLLDRYIHRMLPIPHGGEDSEKTTFIFSLCLFRHDLMGQHKSNPNILYLHLSGLRRKNCLFASPGRYLFYLPREVPIQFLGDHFDRHEKCRRTVLLLSYCS